MPATRPTADQLRFNSAANGESVLDDYMEAVEKGGRSLPDLLDELFDGLGALKNFVDFREDPSNAGDLQFRLGEFIDPEAGWQTFTSTDFSSFVTNCTNAQSYAEEWANANEDTLISAAAGGNQSDEYSAKHHALKSAALYAQLLAGSFTIADALTIEDTNDGAILTVIGNGNAQLRMTDSSAAADEKNLMFVHDNGQISLRCYNDAWDNYEEAFFFNRTGMIPSVMQIDDGSGNLRNVIHAGGGQTIAGDHTVQGILYVGANGAGNSAINFYDDNSNTWRQLYWSDSANTFRIEDNSGLNNDLIHSGGGQRINSNASQTTLTIETNTYGTEVLRLDPAGTFGAGNAGLYFKNTGPDSWQLSAWDGVDDSATLTLGWDSLIINGQLSTNNYVDINTTANGNDARVRFECETGQGNGWLGIPSWNSDQIYFYHPDGAGGDNLGFFTKPDNRIRIESKLDSLTITEPHTPASAEDWATDALVEIGDNADTGGFLRIYSHSYSGQRYTNLYTSNWATNIHIRSGSSGGDKTGIRLYAHGELNTSDIFLNKGGQEARVATVDDAVALSIALG